MFFPPSNKTYKIVKRIFCFGELMQLGKLSVIADGDLSNVKQKHSSNLQRFVARFFSVLTYVTISLWTSSLMLMRQNTNDHSRNLAVNLAVIVCETFNFSWLTRFASVTILKMLLFLFFPMFDRYFNSQFWSETINMHLIVFSKSRSIRIGILFRNLRHLRF